MAFWTCRFHRSMNIREGARVFPLLLFTWSPEGRNNSSGGRNADWILIRFCGSCSGLTPLKGGRLEGIFIDVQGSRSSQSERAATDRSPHMSSIFCPQSTGPDFLKPCPGSEGTLKSRSSATRSNRTFKRRPAPWVKGHSSLSSCSSVQKVTFGAGSKPRQPVQVSPGG